MKEKTIEELAKTFEDYHKIFLKQIKYDIKKFNENYPDSEIPIHLMNDFSISESLAFICGAIKAIQDSIDALHERLDQNDID